MKKIVFIALAVIALFSSCAKIEDFRLVSVDNINMKSMSRVNVGITVENNSRVKVKLVSANFDVERAGSPLAKLMINEPLELPKRRTTSLTVPILIQMKNVFGAISVMSNLDEVKNELTVSGVVCVKAGLGKINYKIDKMPMSQFITTFGEDLKKIER